MKIKSLLLPFLAAAAALSFAACAHREADDVRVSENNSKEQADFENDAAKRRTELAKDESAGSAQATADAAKAEADRVAAEAAKVAADNEARAKAAAAKAEADAKAAQDKADADRVAAETKPADAKPAADQAPAAPVKTTPDVIAAAKSAVALLAIPDAYDVKGRKTVVQVNRARTTGDAVADKGAITAAAIATLESTGRFLTGDTINAANRNADDKAIYLAFDTEARALGLVPSRKLTDAPALCVNIVVSGDGPTPTLVTVTATDSNTGKVVDTRTQVL